MDIGNKEKYEQFKTKVNGFVSECNEHEHYQHLNPRPEHFSGWREDRGIMHEYGTWIMGESNCPSLKMDIEFPADIVLKEVMPQYHQFVKHRGVQHPGWSSMCIHGQGVQYTDPPKEYPDVDEDFHWTTLSEQCPETTKWFKTEWPFTDYDRLRFMLLEPGGFIQPHADFERRRLAAFNIAVSNPPGVDFAMEEAGCIPWEVGDVRAIDIGRRHAVINNSTEDRIHMIVHGKFNQNFKELLCKSYDNLLESLAD